MFTATPTMRTNLRYDMNVLLDWKFLQSDRWQVHLLYSEKFLKLSSYLPSNILNVSLILWRQLSSEYFERDDESLAEEKSEPVSRVRVKRASENQSDGISPCTTSVQTESAVGGSTRRSEAIKASHIHQTESAIATSRSDAIKASRMHQ